MKLILLFSISLCFSKSCTEFEYLKEDACTCKYEIANNKCTSETILNCPDKLTTAKGLNSSLLSLFDYPISLTSEFELANQRFLLSLSTYATKQDLQEYALSAALKIKFSNSVFLDLLYFYSPLPFKDSSMYVININEIAKVCETVNGNYSCKVIVEIADECNPVSLVTYENTIVLETASAGKHQLMVTQKLPWFFCYMNDKCIGTTTEKVAINQCSDQTCTQFDKTPKELPAKTYFKSVISAFGSKTMVNKAVRGIWRCNLVTSKADTALIHKDCSNMIKLINKAELFSIFEISLTLSADEVKNNSIVCDKVKLFLVFELETGARMLQEGAVVSSEYLFEMNLSNSSVEHILQGLAEDSSEKTAETSEDAGLQVGIYILVIAILLIVLFLVLLILFFVTKGKPSVGETNILGNI